MRGRRRKEQRDHVNEREEAFDEILLLSKGEKKIIIIAVIVLCVSLLVFFS